MSGSRRIVTRTLFIAYFAVLHALALCFVAEKLGWFSTQSGDPSVQTASDPKVSAASPDPTPPYLPDQNANLAAVPSPSGPLPSGLVIPVPGVRPEQLIDTYTQARSGGRTHDAIDIPAPGGTPVIAAADGTIVKFFDSERGGITIYELSQDKHFVFYYAHLQRRADGLHEGDGVKSGQIIGFVGDTGNAGAGNYHLHFAISVVENPKDFWHGRDINPYPLLRYGTALQ